VILWITDFLSNTKLLTEENAVLRYEQQYLELQFYCFNKKLIIWSIPSDSSSVSRISPKISSEQVVE